MASSPRSFLGSSLPASANLAAPPRGGALGCWPPGVGRPRGAAPPHVRGADSGLALLRRTEQPAHQAALELGREAQQQLPRLAAVLVDRQPEAEAEIGVVLNTRDGPRG